MSVGFIDELLQAFAKKHFCFFFSLLSNSIFLIFSFYFWKLYRAERNLRVGTPEAPKPEIEMDIPISINFECSSLSSLRRYNFMQQSLIASEIPPPIYAKKPAKKHS